MSYIDGFVIPVPHAKKDAYAALAELVGRIMIENGALRVLETWGDDIEPGHTTDFQRAVLAEEGENVVFSLVVWPSREARDAGNAATMADPRFATIDRDLFNGRRMIHGGFATLVDMNGLDMPKGE